MDIENIISKNIDGYLKPKYPIYKITYIRSKLKYNYEDGAGEPYVKTSRKVGLFQYVDDDDEKVNIDFDECKFYKSVMVEFDENGFYEFSDGDCYYSDDVFNVIGLERLA